MRNPSKVKGRNANSKINSEWDNIKGFLKKIPEGINISPKTQEKLQIKNNVSISDPINNSLITKRSEFIRKEISINPPFVGTRILEKKFIDLA